MTLTDAQARILKAMREGAALELEYGGGYRLILSGPGRQITTEDMELLFWEYEYVDVQWERERIGAGFTLTPAGAEALAAWEAGR